MKSLVISSNFNDHSFSMSSGIDYIDQSLTHGGWQSQTINEVISADSINEQLDILLPTLIKLSEQGRWIVLVGAPKIGLKSLLESNGIDTSRVLLVHPKDQVDALWAMEQALMSGNSSAVLGWPGEIDNRDLKRLQLAAKRTSALTFLFKPTASTQPQIQLNCYNQQLSHQHLSIDRRSGSIH
ncbi:SulA-like leucine-rich domain-containing protein [Psychrobium sp. nBUS_13]|uniref:SulA-like leucine-rich domain-containing protein n=1 Tax=Psychrobium sp. nBUS_13 TaxID=3395319 RepID=UPI003EB743E0